MDDAVGEARLRQHRLAPEAAVLARAPIAGAVPADRDEDQLWMAFRQKGRGPHELGIAAIGIEIARDEGDDGRARCEFAAVRQGEAGFGIRPAEGGIDTVVTNGDALAIGGGVLLTLPLRRRIGRVERVESEELRGNEGVIVRLS